MQYVHNGITTAKYNVATFLPIFLFEMFSRAAYLYFLLQVFLVAVVNDERCCLARRFI